MEEKNKKAWGTFRVPFLAQQKAIQERINAGQPLTHIHRELENVLQGMPYYQFTHYVRKYIHHPKREFIDTPVESSKLIRNHSKTNKAPRFIPPELAPDMSQYI